VGETIPEDRFEVRHRGELVADLPLSALSGSAPEYDRPWEATPPPAPFAGVPDIAPLDALRRLLADPNHACKPWVWEQYDTTVMADTMVPPGSGAGVVRVHGTRKALAFTADVTPRYVAACPETGGMQAVAEAWRNLVAKGATPLAATDNLNFGSPTDPRIMGQIVLALRGIARACEALDMPIVSGNVSLYNETDGRPIPPTPTIGAVGLLADLADLVGERVGEGQDAVLVGETRGHLGRSAILEVLGREDGPPPPVDLDAERRHGAFVLSQAGRIAACQDLSDGGLALAAFEMAAGSGLGVALEPTSLAALLGEDQARYLLACEPERTPDLLAAARGAGVPAAIVGRFGGDAVRLGAGTAPLAPLDALWRGAFEAAVG
jgi:phosphoribosylformylglycinamidine synthase